MLSAYFLTNKITVMEEKSFIWWNHLKEYEMDFLFKQHPFIEGEDIEDWVERIYVYEIIKDLKGAAQFAYKRDGTLTNKQIGILSRKANDKIGHKYFWNWFVSKYGVPEHGDRGFSAGPEQFAFYFFEDYANELWAAKKTLNQFTNQ
jgi:hypothetical protein